MKKVTVLAAIAFTAAPLSAQDVERVRGAEVAVYNLAGRVEIVPGGGSDVVVRVQRGGADAAQLRIETSEIRGRQAMRIIYPSDEIVYPEMGRGSNTSTTVRADGTFSDGGNGRGREGERTSVRGSGRGLEAWADLVIEVPAGQRVWVYLAAGEVNAHGVNAEVDIDTGSGAVTARDMAGRLSIDTGSGRVTVAGMEGDLTVDTGSGSVEATNVTGREIGLDTGSGRVTGRALRAARLVVDTGSGAIDLQGISAADVQIDTGSGSVDLQLLTDVDVLEIDTGAGAVTVRVPSDLGGSVEIDTGSGGIDLDIPVEVRSVRRDHMRGVIGDGRGEIVIDTGSGSVRLIRN